MQESLICGNEHARDSCRQMWLKLKLSRPSWKKKLVLFWKFENLLHFWSPTFKFEVFAAKQFFWCNSFGPESHYDVLAASCTLKCRFVSLALSEVRGPSIEDVRGKFCICPQSSDSTSRIIIECSGWQYWSKLMAMVYLGPFHPAVPGSSPWPTPSPKTLLKWTTKFCKKIFTVPRAAF